MGPPTSRTCEWQQGRARAGTEAFGVGWAVGSTGSQPAALRCPSNAPAAFSRRQLDKNQISCIEDGAFRALRGLEVL